MEKKDKLSERKLNASLDGVDKIIKKLKITDAQFFYNVIKYFDDDYDLFTWNIPDYDEPREYGHYRRYSKRPK